MLFTLSLSLLLKKINKIGLIIKGLIVALVNTVGLIIYHLIQSQFMFWILAIWNLFEFGQIFFSNLVTFGTQYAGWQLQWAQFDTKAIGS